MLANFRNTLISPLMMDFVVGFDVDKVANVFAKSLKDFKGAYVPPWDGNEILGIGIKNEEHSY